MLAVEFLHSGQYRRRILRTDPLVVLSACQTGLGKKFEGGMFGMALNWYYAGAGAVVTSLWNVDDGETHNLMLAFMRRVKEQVPPSRALAEAMAEQRSIRPDSLDWASFTVYGGLPLVAADSQPQTVAPVGVPTGEKIGTIIKTAILTDAPSLGSVLDVIWIFLRYPPANTARRADLQTAAQNPRAQQIVQQQIEAAAQGHRPGTEIRWQANRHLWFQADYGVFFAGEFLKQTQPGRNLNYWALWTGYKF